MAQISTYRLRGTLLNGYLCQLACYTDMGETRQVRIFFDGQTPLRKLAATGLRQEQARLRIGTAPYLKFNQMSSGEQRIRVAGQICAFTPEEPDTQRFAGLKCALSMRNFESTQAVLDWLAYHASFHGLEAAVIVDRAPNDDLENFLRDQKDLPLSEVMIVKTDFPLGRADLPAENHPFCAPAAPGKSRMEDLPPDPERAPLGQAQIYEMLRVKFLSQARAVINIDVADLIASDVPVFDRLEASEHGVIRLEGQLCYAWHQKAKHDVNFRDHGCVQFDARAKSRRWCIAPDKIDPDTPWLFTRIPGAEVSDDATGAFWRFMGLRHQGLQIGKIVSRTSLVEDPDLVALIKTCFGARPDPVPAVKSSLKREKSGGITIISMMKDEGPFILEWIAYHRMIGVDNFLIYTNDCSDGTDKMLQLLDKKGIVNWRENPFKGTDLKPQHAALQAAEDEPLIKNSAWLICMDVDEYMNIKCGDGTLRALFDHLPEANMIACTWRLFGNGDRHHFEDRPIIAQFDQCAAEYTPKPHQAWGFKTLFKNNGLFKKLGVHRPKGLKPQLLDEVNWVNGSGVPLPQHMYRNAWRVTQECYGYDLISLNHYAVRSAESFLVKRNRGRVNHVDRDQGLAYWFRMNNNAQTDRSIQRMLPQLEAEIAKLLDDPEIAAIHAYAVQAHRAKIAELQTQEAYANFYKELTSERMERLSKMHRYFGANVFLAGPTSIPDQIVFEEHADDFYFTVPRQEAVHS